MQDFFLLFAYLSKDVVPRTSEEFKLYLKLRNIYLILSSPVIPKNSIGQLKVDIGEFFKVYDRIFVRRKLAKVVPKIHNLAHYPEFIQRMGPPFHYSTLKFERKHQDPKQGDAASKQFKNKPYSIVKRDILTRVNDFLTTDFQIKKNLKAADFRCPSLVIFKDFIDFNLEISSLKFLSLKKVDFELESVFRILGDPIQFVRIVFLAKQGDKFVIVGSTLKLLEFLEDLQCFKVEQESNLIELRLEMIHYKQCTLLEPDLILHDSFVY